MNVNDWLAAAAADAERRGLTELKRLLESLARSTSSLREEDRTARAEQSEADRSKERNER